MATSRARWRPSPSAPATVGRPAPLPATIACHPLLPPSCLPADEVNAVVLDLGTLQVKAGYAGEDTPKYVFPSVRLLLCRPASVVDSQVPTACYWPLQHRTYRRFVKCL